ncbi:MAG: trigger factor [Prevotella sp.]|nr:trigger factor [Prevotella sp.]
MKISFENPDKINGLMTITVEESDYQEKVEKRLKDYRKKANVPGFRPGQAPMGMIRKQMGPSVKVDEINRLLGEEMYKYIRENNIQMLGEPMPSDKQTPQDLEKEGPYTFMFDVAVAPEFTIQLTDKDKVEYITVKVDDELIDRQVDMYASQQGHYEKVEEYDADQRDMLKGDLRQLDAEGNTLEGGITVDNASLLPQYIKVEEQKTLFDGAHLGDIITFNPKKAYPDNDAEIAAMLKLKKEEVAELTSDFSYQITEISRYVKAPVNQELFDRVFGEGAVANEEEFRQKVAGQIQSQLQGETDYQFLLNVRKYTEEKVGDVTFPEELLKRVMKNNNKDKNDDYVEKNFAGSIRELKWHLIKEQLVAQSGVKVADEDVKETAKEAARQQFAQYGMNNVPDEYLNNYADDMLKKRENIDGLLDRTIDRKLTQALKGMVKMQVKEVSLDDFNKLIREQNAQ